MKPMLATEARGITFPVYASYKIDGIRATAHDTGILSRTLKPIPNLHLQQELGAKLSSLQGLDGELTVGESFAKNVMQTTTSGLMSIGGQPDYTWHVFDIWSRPDIPYSDRYAMLDKYFVNGHHPEFPNVVLLKQVLISSQDELNDFERQALQLGYEGIMVRKVDGHYKYGRSTAKEGLLLKVKRFVQSECVIVGCNELLTNTNEATINELGETTRSTCKEGLVGTGRMGSLDCVDLGTLVPFSIGTGFDFDTRVRMWQDKPIGAIMTYKSFPIGVKEAPRFPVFISERAPEDCEDFLQQQANMVIRRYMAGEELIIREGEVRWCKVGVKPKADNYRMPLLEKFAGTPSKANVDVYRIAAQLKDGIADLPPVWSSITLEELLDRVRSSYDLSPDLEMLCNEFESLLFEEEDDDGDEDNSAEYSVKK